MWPRGVKPPSPLLRLAYSKARLLFWPARLKGIESSQRPVLVQLRLRALRRDHAAHPRLLAHALHRGTVNLSSSTPLLLAGAVPGSAPAPASGRAQRLWAARHSSQRGGSWPAGCLARCSRASRLLPEAADSTSHRLWSCLHVHAHAHVHAHVLTYLLTSRPRHAA